MSYSRLLLHRNWISITWSAGFFSYKSLDTLKLQMFNFVYCYFLSQQFPVTLLFSLLSMRLTNDNHFCLSSLSSPQSDWTCLCIDGLNDVCASLCPVIYFLQSMPSFGCFCFPLFYISMDFPFNLGQHCGGRQGIDFCPTGLTGTRISPSRWGSAAGCDKAQNIALKSQGKFAGKSALSLNLFLAAWRQRSVYIRLWVG